MSKKRQEFFPGIRTPSIDFDEVRDGRRAQPLFFDIDLSIARTAATSQPIKISGNTVFIDQKASSGFCQLVFEDQYPTRPCAITVFPGFVARVPFTQITVLNEAQAAGTVMRVVYGTDIDFVPTTSAGVVIVNTVPVLTIDSRKTRTIAGQAFMGVGGAGPTGAQYSHVQLFNPAASTIRAIVEQILVTSDVAGAIELYRWDTVLTSLISQAPNKYMGAPAPSICELRSQLAGALLGTGPAFCVERVQANITAPAILFSEPIVLTPGHGLLVIHGTVAVALNATFEFFEEPNV